VQQSEHARDENTDGEISALCAGDRKMHINYQLS